MQLLAHIDVVLAFADEAQTSVPPAPPGNEAQVTTAWMAGVVGMMLLFGVIALIGYVRKRMRGDVVPN